MFIVIDEIVNEYIVFSELGNIVVESCIILNEIFGVMCENIVVERVFLVLVDDLLEENFWGSMYDEISVCEWIVIDFIDIVKEFWILDCMLMVEKDVLIIDVVKKGKDVDICWEVVKWDLL